VVYLHKNFTEISGHAEAECLKIISILTKHFLLAAV